MKKILVLVVAIFSFSTSFLNAQDLIVLDSKEDVKSVLSVKDSLTATYMLNSIGISMLKRRYPILTEVQAEKPNWEIRILIYPSSIRTKSWLKKIEAWVRFAKPNLKIYYLSEPLETIKDHKKYVDSSWETLSYPNLVLSNGDKTTIFGQANDNGSVVPQTSKEVVALMDIFE